MYLFLDSTYDLSLGILDEGFNWLSFNTHTGLKASGVLQPKVYEMLTNHQLKASQLLGIFIATGPGFYTGLRLAEGFSDVLTFFGVKQYSFYNYEVPAWCGYTQGTWFTKAYRGEYFFYNWKGTNTSTQLVKAGDLNSSLFEGDIFIHSNLSLDSLSEKIIESPIHTIDLIRSKPKEIFSQVLHNPAREPYYFRAPEDEFKANP